MSHNPVEFDQLKAKANSEGRYSEVRFRLHFHGDDEEFVLVSVDVHPPSVIADRDILLAKQDLLFQLNRLHHYLEGDIQNQESRMSS